MSKLFLVRHGQSIWNSENRFTGWVDVELSKQGESEAHRLKELNIKIVKITCTYLENIFLLEIILKQWSLRTIIKPGN